MIKAWLAAAVGGLSLLGSASTTMDHPRPGFDKTTDHASSTMEMHTGERRDIKNFKNASSTIDVSCLATASATREASIDAALATFTTDVGTAYSTRATALASAYAQTGNDAIRTAVKGAWATFGAGIKLAKKNWQKSREDAWATFRGALKSCGAGAASVADSSNAWSELQ